MPVQTIKGSFLCCSPQKILIFSLLCFEAAFVSRLKEIRAGNKWTRWRKILLDTKRTRKLSGGETRKHFHFNHFGKVDWGKGKADPFLSAGRIRKGKFPSLKITDTASSKKPQCYLPVAQFNGPPSSKQKAIRVVSLSFLIAPAARWAFARAENWIWLHEKPSLGFMTIPIC